MWHPIIHAKVKRSNTNLLIRVLFIIYWLIYVALFSKLYCNTIYIYLQLIHALLQSSCVWWQCRDHQHHNIIFCDWKMWASLSDPCLHQSFIGTLANFHCLLMRLKIEFVVVTRNFSSSTCFVFGVFVVVIVIWHFWFKNWGQWCSRPNSISFNSLVFD